MTVFHLKYRPQKIADLDLSKVSEIISKILGSKEIPQSFLFSGPKGAGKTSAARILARALNCLKPDGVEPCGECENCKEILNGSSMDVIEMDAASNRGIEDIRSLKDKVVLLPTKLKYKVFVIDEVHMLTKDAFNAMLKLIEEPPKHTIFILCTTDPEKIPDTVLSRLIKIDFTKGNDIELKKSLKRIIEGEKVEVEDKGIEEIIRRSDGSFRNLQRTFNEIYLHFGKNIKFENVKDFFENKSGDYAEIDFENDLVSGDVKTILQKLEKMALNNCNFSDFRESLLVHFQKELLACFGIGVKSGKLDKDNLEKILNLLINAGKQEKSVGIDQLPLELAVVDFFGDSIKTENGTGGGSVKKIEVKINKDEQQEKIVKLESKLEEKLIEKEIEPIIDIDLNKIKTNNIDVEIKVDLKEEVDSSEESNNVQLISETVSIPCSSCSIDDIEKGWGDILSVIKPLNHSVEAFLRAARPKSISGNILTVEVFYPFHKDRLEEARNRKIVEEGLTKILKSNLAFECVLSKDKKPPLVIRNDTPMDKVSDQLVNQEEGKADIYDVAKEIFG